MLTICSEQRIRRREFLTVGSLALGGWAWTASGASQVEASEWSRLVKGRSVIFLFQQGGPSQLETFDPKPDAPSGIRTIGGVTPTSIPGIQFGSTMPRLARLADHFTIVRSFQTNNNAHNIEPIVGPDSRDANIGSYYSKVVGATHAASGIPTNTVLFPQSVSSDVAKSQARGNIAASGNLGSVHAPFIPGAGGPLQENMRLRLPVDRFHARQDLIAQMDSLRTQVETMPEFEMLGEFQQQAYRVLLGGAVADALDLSREDPRTLDRYDTDQYTRPDGWSKVRRGVSGMYTGHARALGRQLLLARRLCEAGCGYVTIHAGYDGVWDMHADSNNLNMVDGMEAVGPAFDHAVAAFIEDIESRGLQDKILLVATGEMGRTPKINQRGGRDHWGRLAPLLLYGGGAPRGHVIGQSTRDAGEPVADRLTPKHLIATIMHALFDVGELRLFPSLGAVSELADHPTIPGMG